MTHLLQVCIPYYTLLYPAFVKQKIEKNKTLKTEHRLGFSSALCYNFCREVTKWENV